jgi:hypothetical protein
MPLPVHNLQWHLEEAVQFPSPTREYSPSVRDLPSSKLALRPPRQTFDLHSFAFACDAGVPQPPCAVSVNGTKADGDIVHRTLIFPRLDPGHVLSDFVMNRTHFGPHFKDLKSLSFSIANAETGGDIFGGLMLDDVKYTIKEKVCS